MRIALTSLLLLIHLLIASQNKANDILGYYMSPSGKSILKIYENNGKYYGKPVWMKEPEMLDSKNPDVSKRNQKVFGSNAIRDFVFDGKDTWAKGYIYDPNNGKTYDCKITRDEKGNLNVRGYIGISLIGRTEYFVKVDFKE
ncbi:MAG TPA: DUF2147 domain-containing protein [Bacteroidia bacterium]|nr:DUF2147 domain-containing protein [Bacteroidia bacterium]HRD38348.1 DUF2147 domain-containing protein [Bacteroidia bacterium]